MSRARGWVIVAGLAWAGCHSGESELVEPNVRTDEVVVVVPDRPPPTIPDDDAAPVEPAADVVVVPLGDWGVEITMPREAASRAGTSPDWYGVELTWKRSIGAHRVRAPMPAAIEAHGRHVSVLDQGETESGIRWSLYTFEAYEGFRKAGRNIHRVIHVSRFVALLAIDDKSHAECTGYIESAIGSVEDADDVAKICLSMRKTDADAR